MLDESLSDEEDLNIEQGQFPGDQDSDDEAGFIATIKSNKNSNIENKTNDSMAFEESKHGVDHDDYH